MKKHDCGLLWYNYGVALPLLLVSGIVEELWWLAGPVGDLNSSSTAMKCFDPKPL